jgi:SOS-response transcriptional repressor LexA
MIKVLLLGCVIALLIVWMLKRKRTDDCIEIFITCPFDTLQKGRVAIFKSGSAIEVGDFVLLRLPGYDMIWKVVKREGGKVELENHKKEKLTDFPVCHIWGKLVNYKK